MVLTLAKFTDKFSDIVNFNLGKFADDYYILKGNETIFFTAFFGHCSVIVVIQRINCLRTCTLQQN